MTAEFEKYIQAWKDDGVYNVEFHTELSKLVDADPDLKRHRDWVEANQFGFGDRPFHYVWKMLVDQMPTNFNFLEVGVFKGQVTSLIGMLANRANRVARICGVTTLQNTPDSMCRYPEADYQLLINRIHSEFGVPSPTLFVGKSSDKGVLLSAITGGQWYDIVYIDGNHDYPEVCLDILNYGEMVKPNGYLVMDDATKGRKDIAHLWPGFDSVAKAVSQLVDSNPRYKFLFCCGHLNVFQRLPS